MWKTSISRRKDFLSETVCVETSTTSSCHWISIWKISGNLKTHPRLELGRRPSFLSQWYHIVLLFLIIWNCCACCECQRHCGIQHKLPCCSSDLAPRDLWLKLLNFATEEYSAARDRRMAHWWMSALATLWYAI